MEPNFVYRSASLIASALLAVLLLPPRLGAAEPDANSACQAQQPVAQEAPERDLSENCYTLQVSTQHLQLHEDLGWGPGMLKRLNGLRGALDGEAARGMDAILNGLADDRKKNGVR